jgi:hypothetical protein
MNMRRNQEISQALDDLIDLYFIMNERKPNLEVPRSWGTLGIEINQPITPDSPKHNFSNRARASTLTGGKGSVVLDYIPLPTSDKDEGVLKKAEIKQSLMESHQAKFVPKKQDKWKTVLIGRKNSAPISRLPPILSAYTHNITTGFKSPKPSTSRIYPSSASKSVYERYQEQTDKWKQEIALLIDWKHNQEHIPEDLRQGGQFSEDKIDRLLESYKIIYTEFHVKKYQAEFGARKNTTQYKQYIQTFDDLINNRFTAQSQREQLNDIDEQTLKQFVDAIEKVIFDKTWDEISVDKTDAAIIASRNLLITWNETSDKSNYTDAAIDLILALQTSTQVSNDILFTHQLTGTLKDIFSQKLDSNQKITNAITDLNSINLQLKNVGTLNSQSLHDRLDDIIESLDKISIQGKINYQHNPVMLEFFENIYIHVHFIKDEFDLGNLEKNEVIQFLSDQITSMSKKAQDTLDNISSSNDISEDEMTLITLIANIKSQVLDESTLDEIFEQLQSHAPEHISLKEDKIVSELDKIGAFENTVDIFTSMGESASLDTLITDSDLKEYIKELSDIVNQWKQTFNDEVPSLGDYEQLCIDIQNHANIALSNFDFSQDPSLKEVYELIKFQRFDDKNAIEQFNESLLELTSNRDTPSPIGKS